MNILDDKLTLFADAKTFAFIGSEVGLEHCIVASLVSISWARFTPTTSSPKIKIAEWSRMETVVTVAALVVLASACILKN